MEKNASDNCRSRHAIMTCKRLTTLLLAVLLAGVSLPAEVFAESTDAASLTIGGKEVTADTAQKDYGFSMEIVGNEITMQVNGQSSILEPLRVNGSLVITGDGSLTVNAGSSTDYALFATENITIESVNVTASSQKRAAIYSPGDIYIESSTVKASGPAGSKGILAGRHVLVSDSWLESTGYNYELSDSAGSVVFQEDEEGIMTGTITGNSEETDGVLLLQDHAVLPGNLEIPEDINLIILSGEKLTIPAGCTLTVAGTVENHGEIHVEGTLEDPDEKIDNCEEEGKVFGVKIRDLFLQPEEEILNVGGRTKCQVQPVPYYAEPETIAWKSSDSSIVQVDADGVLQALKAGTVTITAAAGTAEAECEITVTETEVTGVSLNQTSAAMHVKDTLQLTAEITPATAENKNVTWSSEDENIAVVDNNGLVTAKNAGTTIITVTTENRQKTASCQITVEAIPVQSITLDHTEERLPVGEILQLKASILPENATEQGVTWSSSDEQVASVDQNGKVTAKAEGTVQITAAAKEGNLTASCEITVYTVAVEAITLTPASTTLPIGKTLLLKPAISPANATNQKVIWISGDPDIATVDHNGLVKALKTGKVTITAAAADGTGITGTSEITVITIPVTGVKLNRTAVSIPDDGAITLKAEVFPADATNQTVTWSSSNPKAAVVNAGGTVKAVKAGTTYITVTTADGKKTAACTVTVTAPDKQANTAALNKKIRIDWKTKKKGLVLTWGKAPDADGYEIYAAKCGDDLKLEKTISGAKTTSFTLKKVNGKKLKDQNSYKAYVRAYRIFNGKKQYLARSSSVHTVMSKNKRFTNARKLTVSQKNITIKSGKFRKLKVKTISQDQKKKLLNHTEDIRYFSSDGKVAVVTTYGTVRAVGKGKCTIYAMAVNGVKTTVQVTVK